MGSQVATQYTDDPLLARKLQNIISRRQMSSFRGYDHMVSAYFEALAKNAVKSESTQEK